MRRVYPALNQMEYRRLNYMIIPSDILVYTVSLLLLSVIIHSFF